MKQVLELFPIVIFFIAYQMNGDTIQFADWEYTFDGIFSATAALLIATAIQAIVMLAIYRKLEKREIITIALVVAFSTLTLAFHNELFIIWKPTVFNWAMALGFLLTPVFSDKTLVERIMGSSISLPAHLWTRLNLAWVAHFTIVGSLNLYVAFSFSEKTWVSYKMYSSIGFTVFLLAVTIAIVAPHIKQQTQQETEE